MEQLERGPQLHDRATRGGVLSLEEQAKLDAWYGEMDREEAGILAGKCDYESLAGLRAQVRESLRELRTVTQRIEELAAENDRWRREIAALAV